MPDRSPPDRPGRTRIGVPRALLRGRSATGGLQAARRHHRSPATPGSWSYGPDRLSLPGAGTRRNRARRLGQAGQQWLHAPGIAIDRRQLRAAEEQRGSKEAGQAAWSVSRDHSVDERCRAKSSRERDQSQGHKAGSRERRERCRDVEVQRRVERRHILQGRGRIRRLAGRDAADLLQHRWFQALEWECIRQSNDCGARARQGSGPWPSDLLALHPAAIEPTETWCCRQVRAYLSAA
jgi:hypothetical protein